MHIDRHRKSGVLQVSRPEGQVKTEVPHRMPAIGIAVRTIVIDRMIGAIRDVQSRESRVHVCIEAMPELRVAKEPAPKRSGRGLNRTQRYRHEYTKCYERYTFHLGKFVAYAQAETEHVIVQTCLCTAVNAVLYQTGTESRTEVKRELQREPEVILYTDAACCGCQTSAIRLSALWGM